MLFFFSSVFFFCMRPPFGLRKWEYHKNLNNKNEFFYQ